MLSNQPLFAFSSLIAAFPEFAGSLPRRSFFVSIRVPFTGVASLSFAVIVPLLAAGRTSTAVATPSFSG